MRNTTEPTKHMDMCQGKSLFHALSLNKTETAKGRNDIYKFLFNKQVGVNGGIYENMMNFDKLYPEASATFKRNLVDLKIIPYEPPKRSY